MTSGDLAAQHVRAAPPDRRLGGRSEQPFTGRVEAHHAAVGIDLQDEVGRPIDDGAQLVPLALERLPHRRALERDHQFVTREQRDPQAILIEVTPIVGHTATTARRAPSPR